MDHTISGAGFRRRIYSGPLHFLRDLGRVAGVFGSVLALSMKGGISAGFRERLMLVVTAVNRCRHCAWGHQIFARHAGLSPAEIAALLMLDLGNCPADELPGLRYAIHGAERDGVVGVPALADRLLVAVSVLELARGLADALHQAGRAGLMGLRVDHLVLHGRRPAVEQEDRLGHDALS